MEKRNFRRVTNVSRDSNGNLSVQEGDTFNWEDVGGHSWSGEVIEIDSNVASVKLKDGTMRYVEL